MGTQSILLFEEKAFWSLQGNTFLWLSVRKMTPFPSITAEKQTLQSKKLEESSYKHAFYTVPTRISEPKIFRSGYPAGANVLEQENAWERWPKNGLTGKRTQSQDNGYCLDLLESLGCFTLFLATFESWVRRKSVKPGLERWQIG